MKTRKHGHGMTHKQVVQFSNRLMYSGIQPNTEKEEWAYQYMEGWKDACKYFAHELRKVLRYCEELNEI